MLSLEIRNYLVCKTKESKTKTEAGAQDLIGHAAGRRVWDEWDIRRFAPRQSSFFFMCEIEYNDFELER